ncbi:MAG: TetR/AcrR family transcriptional regulator [Deltaproteobacteria bacterium]|nr:MAG: TetR/AcrR family transcriptional regulator [Deltaproteobacteria bacterium]
MEEPRTKKGEATRQKLLDTAVELFTTQGYEKTTMRAVAREAGVSVGLAYRYFEGKEALVAGLYAGLAERFVAEVALPEGSWTSRGLHALNVSLALLEPHRGVLAQLMASSFAHHRLSPALADSAAQVEAVFRDAVSGARMPPPQAERLGEVLYFGQLLVLLFWVLDQSEGQRATRALRAWLAGTVPMLGFAVMVPGVLSPVFALLDIARHGILGEVPTARSR